MRGVGVSPCNDFPPKSRRKIPLKNLKDSLGDMAVLVCRKFQARVLWRLYGIFFLEVLWKYMNVFTYWKNM